MIKLLVGLGNPGPNYQGHRHNVGFMLVDCIYQHFSFSLYKQKFKALFAEGLIHDQKIALLKPQTYMNLSGESVQAYLQFYKIKPEEICVIYDELDLPFGRIKIKQGGGSGGHNGIKSLDQHIGTNYYRLRFGIGHPGDKALVHNYVLSNFSLSEQELLAQYKARFVKAIDDLIINHDGASRFLNKYYQE